MLVLENEFHRNKRKEKDLRMVKHDASIRVTMNYSFPGIETFDLMLMFYVTIAFEVTLMFDVTFMFDITLTY